MAKPIGYEASCPKCGETFNPSGPNDLEHVETLLGEPCGGQGELVGEWNSRSPEGHTTPETKGTR